MVGNDFFLLISFSWVFTLIHFAAIWHVMGKVTVIAKRELLYVGTFGIAAWLCGLIFINKKSRKESRDVMKEAVEGLKKENIKLWIFPEGRSNV